MVPWDALRRLLGLPADMSPPDSVDLVRMAIDRPRHARLIGMALRGCVPKEAPAAMLVAAGERGALPPYAVAELLGCVGHAAGYAAARALLFGENDAKTYAAAGIACARILGARAEADLSIALRASPTREAREGAAIGLCEIGSAEAAATIAEAGRDGRVRMRLAARCAVRMPFDASYWLEQLESSDLRSRRYGTELVYELLAGGGATDARRHLYELGDRAKEAVRAALEDPRLYMLPEKREVLARWVGH
ncbi:MAG TPA: hypothetical protein VIL20_09945 [Sandaracinaceae bacterium]